MNYRKIFDACEKGGYNIALAEPDMVTCRATAQEIMACAAGLENNNGTLKNLTAVGDPSGEWRPVSANGYACFTNDGRVIGFKRMSAVPAPEALDVGDETRDWLTSAAQSLGVAF